MTIDTTPQAMMAPSKAVVIMKGVTVSLASSPAKYRPKLSTLKYMIQMETSLLFVVVYFIMQLKTDY